MATTATRTVQAFLADPRVAAAVDELKSLISAHYPATTYELAAGDDPVGLYVTATVDVEDPDMVVDVFVDRLLDLQVEEGLPLYVIPIRTPQRRRAIPATMEAALQPLVIVELAQTCLACPSQWDGMLADGRPLYIRYRWGNLRVRLGVAGEEIFTQHLPGADDLDGFIELDEVLHYTGLQLAEGVAVTEHWDE